MLYNQKNILITGGGGFVGKNLVRILLNQQVKPYNITVIDKDENGIKHCQNLGVKAVLADLAEMGEWQAEFNDKNIIVDLHAQISAEETEPFVRNNVIATQNIVKVAQEKNIPEIIHFSSAAVLSSRQDDYARTKKQGEEIVKNSGLKYVVIQPSLMYGLLDNKNVGWLIDFARKTPIFPIPGKGKFPRQPIYVDDMCCLISKFIYDFPDENRVYSINGYKILEFNQIIKPVLKMMKGRHTTIHIPVPIFLFLVKIYGLILKSPFTPDQIKSLVNGDVFPEYPWWNDFKIQMTPYEEGVRRMLEKRGLLKNK
ncbi:MAG: NAD(P)-dependent oxidoreductase [Patescibacteria group bacterium]|nr:NAD(P)-dependent oxidoreductase [Patescibacteria group bacterium]